MGLRDWFRRHRNVFSYTTEWVDTGSGAVETMEEEYGERATETINANPGGPIIGRGTVGGVGALRTPSTRTSVDGVLEIGEDDAGEEKPDS